MGIVYLVRHGQASWGAANYDVLSDLGQRQARAVGEALRVRGVVPSVVVCGAMQRHQQTARACLDAMGCSGAWDVDPSWNEYDHEAMLSALDARYGTRAGLAFDLMAQGKDLREGFQAILERALARWSSGAHDDDYDESFLEFSARCEAALARACARASKAQTALVFTSGGPIARAASGLLGLGEAAWAKLSGTLVNASLTKVVVGRRGVSLSVLNEHGFLEGEGAPRLTYR
jgi:broad specificity phosphatase PhoE